MDMKLRGTYIARQLSFKGVAFRTEEIPVPKDFHHAYNQSVQLVSHHFYSLCEHILMLAFCLNDNASTCRACSVKSVV